MRSTTSGTVNTSAPRMKNKKKQHSLDAILNLIPGIQLQICLTKKEQHITVFSLHEVAVLLESTASTITKSQVLKIVNVSTKPKISLEEPGSALLERI